MSDLPEWPAAVPVPRRGGGPQTPEAKARAMANLRRGGGRKTPNRITTNMREAVSRLAIRNVDQVQGWLERVAERSPARAIDLYLRLLEFHMPKLARTEVTGEDGGALVVKIVRFGGTQIEGEVVEAERVDGRG